MDLLLFIGRGPVLHMDVTQELRKEFLARGAIRRQPLLVCSREKADSELHKRLIDDLKKATNEFLEMREELSPRINRELARLALLK